MMCNKKQKVLNIIFVLLISCSTLLSWFGAARGIQEIKGTIIFYNPITILLMIVIIASVLMKHKTIDKIMSAVGFIGLLAIEIWYFLTWYILTITGEFNLSNSFAWAYPEFYLALIITFIACIINVVFCVTDSCN